METYTSSPNIRKLKTVGSLKKIFAFVFWEIPKKKLWREPYKIVDIVYFIEASFFGGIIPPTFYTSRKMTQLFQNFG